MNYIDKGIFEKFAELIRADEREACARTASEYATFGYDGHKIAKAIRARGEVK